jgi:HEAT repeat protein
LFLNFKKIGKKHVEDIHNLVQQQDIGSSKKTFLLYVLGDIANPQSKDLFLKLLKAKDTKVQAMSLRGLYKLKICPPIKDAKRLAKSDNMDVRKYLALSLHPCEGKGAVIPLLVKLQRDKDFNVRYATAEAIKQ